MNKKQLIRLLGWATLLVMGGVGMLILKYIHGQSLKEFFKINPDYLKIGALYGIVAGFLAIGFIHTKFMQPVRKFYLKYIQTLSLSLFDIIFISICAGVGEEILFRGSIQPWLGIWPTAVIFVAIHGYLNPKSRVFFYGVLMVLISAGFGYFTERISIWVAITAHTIIDILLFVYLIRELQNEKDYE
jgi:hypothetical protein